MRALKRVESNKDERKVCSLPGFLLNLWRDLNRIDGNIKRCSTRLADVCLNKFISLFRCLFPHKIEISISGVKRRTENFLLSHEENSARWSSIIFRVPHNIFPFQEFIVENVVKTEEQFIKRALKRFLKTAKSIKPFIWFSLMTSTRNEEVIKKFSGFNEVSRKFFKSKLEEFPFGYFRIKLFFVSAFLVFPFLYFPLFRVHSNKNKKAQGKSVAVSS